MNRVKLKATPPAATRQDGHALEMLAANLLRLGIRGRIQRVDISRRGELTVQATVGGQQQWLRVDPGLCAAPVTTGQPRMVEELTARSDRRITLSRQLSALESTPGMTVLSYLPDRRLVILDSRGPHSEVQKGFRKGKAAGLQEKYSLASRCEIPGRFFTPGPVRYNADHDCLTMQFADGAPFQVSGENSEVFEDFGCGIRSLQSLDDPAGMLAHFHRADELEVIDERARRMGLIGCAIPKGWRELRARLEMLSPLVPEGKPVPTHRDLHDGQLIRSHRGVGLLDFDLLCMAEPELDPANFIAHLYLRRLQMPHRVSDACVQACGRKFLDGLDAYERDGFWARLRFYQATSLCRLQLVYALRPRWNSITTALGRLGQRCLDDMQHGPA